MTQQAISALAHPIFDPDRQQGELTRWHPERLISAALSCNIGME